MVAEERDELEEACAEVQTQMEHYEEELTAAGETTVPAVSGDPRGAAQSRREASLAEANTRFAEENARLRRELDAVRRTY